MTAAVLKLLRPRTFAAMKPREGKARFCRNCTLDWHTHVVVPCSGCGRSFRMCLLRGGDKALSECESHQTEGR